MTELINAAKRLELQVPGVMELRTPVAHSWPSAEMSLLNPHQAGSSTRL